MSKLKKLITLGVLFVFFSAFLGLGLSAVFQPEEHPLIYVSEEISVQTINTATPKGFFVKFSGKIANTSKEDLEDVVVKIYFKNKTTAQILTVYVILDDFLAGQEYDISSTFHKTPYEPTTVEKISFSIDDSTEVVIDNPEEITDFADIIIYFGFAFILLVSMVSILFTKAKTLKYNDDDEVEEIEDLDDLIEEDDDNKSTELAQKELEVEKLKLEVEKQKLENSKLQQAETLRTCPYCGTVSKSKTLKCPSCGANLKH